MMNINTNKTSILIFPQSLKLKEVRPFSSSLRRSLKGSPRLKSAFFIKTYLEALSGPSPQLKSVFRRIVRAELKAGGPLLRPVFPNYLMKAPTKAILQRAYEECRQDYLLKLKRSAMRSRLYEKTTKVSRRQTLNPVVVNETYFFPQHQKEAYSPLPLSFSKPYVLPYLRQKYETYPWVLNEESLMANHQLRSQSLFPQSSITKLTSLLPTSWFIKWQNFTKLYISLNLVPHGELYLRARKKFPFQVKHFLQIKFKGPKLSINLLDIVRQRTHIGVTPGLFLKYFQNKKSLRKNKSMKLLMVRFLRKILLILRLKNIIILSRGVPVNIDLLLSTLFRPLSHPFIDPVSNEIIDETQKTTRSLAVSTIMFLTPKPFGAQKTKKKGRVKRKIRRRIVRLNSVRDEA